jgi:uncharacterized membrane protein
MSTADKILLWCHIAAVMFFLGPLTIATASTPRYIRSGEVAVLRHLHRITRIFGSGSILVLLFGLGLAHKNISKPWLTVSMTLFVVGMLLVLFFVEPDQRKAIRELDEGRPAEVYRGRIVAISSTVGLMWLVVLALMVWQPGAVT